MSREKQKPTRQEKREMRREFKEAVRLELRQHKSSFMVFSVLRVLVVLTLVRQGFLGNYESVFLCALTLALLFVPSIIQVRFRVELPAALEIILLLFIFAAEILGEINEFYIRIPMWDTWLHTLNGFLAAGIGFSLALLLNDSERVVFDLSPLFLALVAFCFSMTVGVIWEFFEFFMDHVFLLDMQKDTIVHTISSVELNPGGHNIPYVIRGITDVAVNGQSLGLGGYLDIGLIDTMKDLFVNFIGAVVFSAVGFVFVKNRGKGGLASQFIPQKKTKDTDYLARIQEENREASERSQGNK